MSKKANPTVVGTFVLVALGLASVEHGLYMAAGLLVLIGYCLGVASWVYLAIWWNVIVVW